MKQKLLNSTLYVFDVNPYIITEDASEATVIKVQEECYKGFVEMNPDLVDKLTKYNYHVVCVNTPEWAPYADDPSSYTITLDAYNLSDQNIEVKLNDNQVVLTGEYVCQNNDTLTFWPLANQSDYIASNMDGFDDTPGQEHWWKIVDSSETIGLTYLGAGVNFNASWGNGAATPENVSEVDVCGHSVTGNDLTDPNWTETVRAYPGSSRVIYYVSTGLPTDMEKFEIDFKYNDGDAIASETHFAYKQTDSDTGEAFYSDAADASGTGVTNPGIWQYNNTPDSGLPWIAFTLPSTDKDGNAYPNNVDMKICALVSGS